jgi:hypothetical protein
MLKKLLKIWRSRQKRQGQLRPAMQGVERIVRTRCPNLILDRKNRGLMMDAVQTAMNHAAGLINQIPGPVECVPENWDTDPALNALFVDSDAIRQTLETSQPLKTFFKQTDAPRCVALLTAAWQEKTMFGTVKEGEILRRGVAQQAISFEDHQFVAPAEDLETAKTALKKEVLVSLCRQTFGQTRDLKEWEAELKQQRDLLAFKINPGNGGTRDDAYAEEKQVLGDIDRKIQSIQDELGNSESNFRYMIGILSKPQELIRFDTVSLRLSRLGIVLNAESDPFANELTLAKYKIGQMPERGAIWAIVSRDAVEAPRSGGN